MLHPAANSHPEATHQASYGPFGMLHPAANRHPKATHINGFLWASKPAVCQPLNP